jgi:arginyl-tRNA synthetase
MENKIKQEILNHSIELFNEAISENLIQFQQTRKEFNGDITLVIFPFVKILKTSPQETAQKIGDFLQSKIKEISKYEVVQGFLNLTLNDEFWLDKFNEVKNTPNFGFEKANSKGTLMVEYASPNTNKPLHLGHLRNIFLGFSVAEILKAAGHKVIKTQIINDRGIHICKSMLAWERFSPLNEKGERETPENSGLKGDKLVGKYYVEFDKQLNKEAKEIIEKWNNQQFEHFSEETKKAVLNFFEAKKNKDEKAISAIDDKIKELAKNETSILLDAKQMLVKWEARDPHIYLLWSTMNGWVYKGFEKTYQTMGVDFDKNYYESDTYLIGKEVIAEGLRKGVFYKKEDGSVWIDLSDEGLDEKLLLRSDGTAVYITQDIGTAIERFKDYPDLEGVTYTVGNEQDYHFKVLFLILKKMGYKWADSCYHLSYGMVDLPSGKMKSREGTVVDADDLMEEVIESAKIMTQERGHIEGMSNDEKENLFRMIGLGGLKYYLLKVDPKKRMLYNPEESIELNGNTGPFIQYAHARIQSLLKKAKEISNYSINELGKDEKEIIKQMIQFPNIILEAAKEQSPAVIINYCYDLVKEFNQFYQNKPILIEENEDVKNLRLQICKNVGEIIHKSMKLIGVEVPNRM